jgi:hypothetical protein
MKLFAVLFWICCGMNANAQSLCLRGGKSLVPADYFSLRYTHPTNGKLHFVFGVYHERSHRDLLQYTSFGMDLMTELYSNHAERLDQGLGLSSAIGLCWQAEHEPWLYKDWPLSKRSSFGLAGEINAHWFLSSAFTLSSFFQQKMLFNPLLGRYRLMGGLGIHYRFSSY